MQFLRMNSNSITDSARITGGQGDPPTAVVDAHVIHGVEVSALSAAQCRRPTAFFLVRPLITERVRPCPRERRL